MKSFYGRRISKKIKKSDLNELYNSKLYLSEQNLKKKIFNFKKKFRKINLEIGFGTGENLLGQAKQNLNHAFVGCDPFLNGNLNVFKKAKNLLEQNILITDMDFNNFFINVRGKLKFSKIFILFPDPWPKKKHNKRRLINKNFLEKIEKIIENQGKIIITTDCYEYFEEIIYIFKNNHYFQRIQIPKKIENGQDSFQISGLSDTKYYKKSKNKLIDPKIVSYKLSTNF